VQKDRGGAGRDDRYTDAGAVNGYHRSSIRTTPIISRSGEVCLVS